MVFGILNDIKEGENRVICTPVEAASIRAAGYTVLVQSGAGVGAGFPDEKYTAAGAEIVADAAEMWQRCDFLAKVKEIEPSEFGLPREGQMLYCCVHPAGHPEEVDALLKSKCIAITAEDSHRYGSPNCEAAGKQGALFGLESMLTINGGKGKFVGGFAGAPGMNVLILGGGTVGYYLATRLVKEGMHVKIVESNFQRCQELSAGLPDVDIIHGDVSDQDLLLSEGMPQYDALVSCTGADELNMIVSLYAANCGVPQVITRLSNADNRSLIDSLSLGSIICPKDLCSNNIARYVRAMKNQTGAALTVHSIADGNAEAMEFKVDEHTRCCGKPLKEIKLKPNVLLVSISHGAAPEIANGESMFQPGDIVVVVTNGREVLYQLNDIFA